MKNRILLEFDRNLFTQEKIDSFIESLNSENFGVKVIREHTNVFNNIRRWAEDRGIYESGDVKTQFVKLQEESGELAKAILKSDKTEFIDAIGDCVVVLTNLAMLNGCFVEDCIESAYDVISKRKGKMENGTFVKNS